MKVERLDINLHFNIIDSPRLYERFKSTDRAVYDPHLFEPMIYSCPKCEYEIQFKDEDFRKHSHSKFSNLNEVDNDYFNNYVVNRNFTKYSFLDFYCPSCTIGTRIYFRDGYGGKGDYLVHIELALVLIQ